MTTPTTAKRGDPMFDFCLAGFACLLFMALGGVMGWRMGSEVTRSQWRQEAIESGHAEYDKQTGILRWKYADRTERADKDGRD